MVTSYKHIVLLLFILAGTSLFAQNYPGRWESYSTPYRYQGYDKDTVIAIKGEIYNIERCTLEGSDNPGLHLKLVNLEKIKDVVLSSRFFANNMNLQLKVGDRVEISGKYIEYLGRPAIYGDIVMKDYNRRRPDHPEGINNRFLKPKRTVRENER